MIPTPLPSLEQEASTGEGSSSNFEFIQQEDNRPEIDDTDSSSIENPAAEDIEALPQPERPAHQLRAPSASNGFSPHFFPRMNSSCKKNIVEGVMPAGAGELADIEVESTYRMPDQQLLPATSHSGRHRISRVEHLDEHLDTVAEPSQRDCPKNRRANLMIDPKQAGPSLPQTQAAIREANPTQQHPKVPAEQRHEQVESNSRSLKNPARQQCRPTQISPMIFVR